MDRSFQRIRSLMLRGTFYSVPPKKIKKKLSTFAFFILNEVEIGISNNFYLQGFQNKFIFAR